MRHIATMFIVMWLGPYAQAQELLTTHRFDFAQPVVVEGQYTHLIQIKSDQRDPRRHENEIAFLLTYAINGGTLDVFSVTTRYDQNGYLVDAELTHIMNGSGIGKHLRVFIGYFEDAKHVSFGSFLTDIYPMFEAAEPRQVAGQGNIRRGSIVMEEFYFCAPEVICPGVDSTYAFDGRPLAGR